MLNNKKKKIWYLVFLEFRLALRNSRSKALLFLSIIVSISLIFQIYFWHNSKINDEPLVMISRFVFMNISAGLFCISYGQYNFSWDSSHFNFLCVNKINWKDYFISKIAFSFFSTISMSLIVALFILFFEKPIFLFYYLCVIIFNIGINSFTSLFIGIYNTQKIDISTRGAFANWQGKGKNQQFLALPYVITILLAIFVGFYKKNFNISYYIILSIGVIFLSTIRWWLDWMVKIFKKNRYKIIQGFNN